MYTGHRSHWRLCRRLLQEGADVALRDKRGNTALDYFDVDSGVPPEGRRPVQAGQHARAAEAAARLETSRLGLRLVLQRALARDLRAHRDELHWDAQI